MKRALLIAIVLSMVLGLFAGCKQQEDESALLGEAVQESFMENAGAGSDQLSSGTQNSSPQQPSQGGEEEIDPDTPVSNQPSGDSGNTASKPAGSGDGNTAQNQGSAAGSQGQTEQPKDEPAKEEEPSKQPEAQPEEQPKEEEKDYSDYLTIVSYNIKSLLLDKEGVVEMLRQLDGDVVGLQEVDYYNARSDNSDQTEYLARKLGYPYYYFVNCSGHYGTAILSRYPMKVTEHEYGNYVGSEVRKFGRAEITIDGKKLVFYNTHLTTGTWEQTGIQFKELLNFVYKEKDPTVVVGDFNLSVVEMKKRMYPQLLFPLHGGMEMTHKLPAISWDNIFIKNIDDYYWEILDEENGTGVGVKVVESQASDHNPIYTHIKLS